MWHVRDFIGQRAVMAHVLRAVAWRPASLLAISRSVADDVAAALGRDDATVIYNGIDTGRFTPDGERADLDALAELGPCPTGAARVGLVATYARWKGQAHFLDAAARVARDGGRDLARFYVVGGRTYATEDSQFSRDELRAEIAKRGLEGIAGLVPFQNDPAGAYRALDVVVHASTRPEPFGRTIAEAMVCAKPVVAAREGGAAELVSHDARCARLSPRATWPRRPRRRDPRPGSRSRAPRAPRRRSAPHRDPFVRPRAARARGARRVPSRGRARLRALI